MKQQYEQELKKLAEQNNGELTPQIVVEAAEDNKSPLHDYFEWDDEAAGVQYRLWQARKLIVKVKVELEDQEIQEFYSIKLLGEKESDRRYVQIDKILREEEMRQRLLNECLEEFMYWRNKYSSLKELVKNHKLLDEVEIKLTKPSQ